MNTLTFLNILRGLLIFEITCTLLLSSATMVYYSKRLRANKHLETRLTWHVILMAAAFILLSADVLVWGVARFGTEEFHWRMPFYLVVFATTTFAQYLMFARQSSHFSQGK